jgi:aminopeptidase-like protein
MKKKKLNQSNEINTLFKRLFPINRSITGNGLRESLQVLREYIPYKILEFKSGTKCFDWTIPKEWNIKDAYVKDSDGNRIIDFKKHNLHVLNYSKPINKKVSKDELLKHIYTKEELPDAIPYRTSYYKERWGFCLEYNRLKELVDDEYEVCIDSTLEDGSLSIAEYVIKGKSDKEILISSYMCHPSMANNELSGPIALTMLAKHLKDQKDLKYTYRFVIAPETIGSIVYLSQYYEKLKSKVIAGYVISQVGIANDLIYKESRDKNALCNKAINNVVDHSDICVDVRSFTPDGGGDQRQYTSLAIDMPIGYLGRSLGGSYKEYHSSLDTLDIVSDEKMVECIELLIDIVLSIELNSYYINNMPYCEPNLGSRGLYPTIGGEKASQEIKIIKYILGYSDGNYDLIDIANLMNQNVLEFKDIIEKMIKSGIVSEKDII